MPVVHILAVEEPTARHWLTSLDQRKTKANGKVLDTHVVALEGVDEADFVAFYMAISGKDADRASRMLSLFASTEHGVLLRVPSEMVVAMAKSRIDKKLLDRVMTLALKMRGEPKCDECVQLGIEDLQKISRVCSTADKVPIFIHLSE
jgi:hypothetical protein